jgi:tetratricopeptide (TPR) repeat protein
MTQNSHPLARAIEEYEGRNGWKRSQTAEYLGVELRTLYRWMSQKSPLTDTRELRRIALLLGIEPEKLIVGTLSLPLTPEDIEQTITSVWKLIKESHHYEAKTTAERLVDDIASCITSDTDLLLPFLAKARQCAGHASSAMSRTHALQTAIYHYHEMEEVARLIKNDTLINIALTYQGDMLRRQGNLRGALPFLEAAKDTTPLADPSARGNALQLLGRIQLQSGDTPSFLSSMSEATELLDIVNLETDITYGFYCPGTVYEEYARSYAILGEHQKALDYLDKSEQSLPPLGHWETMLKTARAMILVRAGDLRNGLPLAVEASQLCYKLGDIRHLERMFNLQKYLDHMSRDFVSAGAQLRDVLDGTTEYTG